MAQGTIRKLVHLCNGTDFPTTHLVASHNGVGYGYIQSPAGDVFFDDLGLKNARFDQLHVNMTAEYELESAPYLRASSVRVLPEKSDIGPGDVKLISSRASGGGTELLDTLPEGANGCD